MAELPGQVRMDVDETRKQGRIAQVNFASAGRKGNSDAHLFDAVTPNENVLCFEHATARRVEKTPRVNQGDLRGGRMLCMQRGGAARQRTNHQHLADAPKASAMPVATQRHPPTKTSFANCKPYFSKFGSGEATSKRATRQRGDKCA